MSEVYFQQSLLQEIQQHEAQAQDSRQREALTEAEYEAWLAQKRESENP